MKVSKPLLVWNVPSAASEKSGHLLLEAHGPTPSLQTFSTRPSIPLREYAACSTESGCLRYFANVEIAQVYFVFEMVEKGFIPAVPKLRFDFIEIFKVAHAVRH